MRYKNIKPLSEQTLNEINMSPSGLRKLASKINAKAGMEFEMIVPDAESDSDTEQEPDYDFDESVNDIDDACRFFDDGDFNGRQDIRNLRESMEEDFHNWQSEQIENEWDRHGFEFFMEYMQREDPFDPTEHEEDAEEYVRRNEPDIDPGSDSFEELKSERLQELETEYYTEAWGMEGRSFNDAREEFEDEQRDNFGESEWLDDAGLRAMSDIQNNYDISWPHRTTGSNGGRAVADIADEFSRAIGRPVNHSNSYHGARREEGTYVVEPDGSLEGKNSSDSGLEFVSPPLPINELLSDLAKVKKWADAEGCYTGADYNTGLHINVSVDGWAGIENLDYVKLAILLGDDYVLQQFERQSNTYCKSALGLVKTAIKNDPSKATQLLDKMKEHMNTAASKLVHSGITSKFTSINTKDGYVEFRSPGGDWLNEKFELIEPTLLRFVVALDAAVKPDLYKQEYLKKLYKLISPSGDKSTIEFFSKYVAGEMPKAALKSFIRQAQLQRNVAAGKAEGKMWWNATQAGRGDNNNRIEVVGENELDAKIAAAKAWGFQPTDSVLKGITVKALRPYEEKPAQQGGGIYKMFDTSGTLIAGADYGNDQEALERAKYWALRRTTEVIVKNEQGQEVGRVSNSGEITTAAQPQQGNWGIWASSINRFVRAPGQIDNSVLRRFPSREAAEQFLAQTRAERPDTRTDVEVREIEPAAPIPGSTLDLQRQRAAQQGVDTTVDYEIYNRENGNAVAGFPARNDEEAIARLDNYRTLRHPNDTNNYGVRRGPGVSAPAVTAPQTLTRPGQGQQQFTGEWKVVDSQGQELYRFNGVGNSQADANRVAAQWAQRNQVSDEVNVVPVMN